MITKIYWSIWAAVVVLAAVLIFAGLFSVFTAVVFGFVIFALVFMGIISILPATITHPRMH